MVGYHHSLYFSLTPVPLYRLYMISTQDVQAVRAHHCHIMALISFLSSAIGLDTRSNSAERSRSAQGVETNIGLVIGTGKASYEFQLSDEDNCNGSL